MQAIGDRSIDLIVSNPPYVPLKQREGLQREVRDWEPHVAFSPARPDMRYTAASSPTLHAYCAPAAGW